MRRRTLRPQTSKTSRMMLILPTEPLLPCNLRRRESDKDHAPKQLISFEPDRVSAPRPAPSPPQSALLVRPLHSPATQSTIVSDPILRHSPHFHASYHRRARGNVVSGCLRITPRVRTGVRACVSACTFICPQVRVVSVKIPSRSGDESPVTHRYAPQCVCFSFLSFAFFFLLPLFFHFPSPW